MIHLQDLLPENCHRYIHSDQTFLNVENKDVAVIYKKVQIVQNIGMKSWICYTWNELNRDLLFCTLRKYKYIFLFFKKSFVV